MTFLHPLILVGLAAIPLLIWWYTGQQRRRTEAASAFAAPKLAPSVAPHRPRWRRHAPMLVFALALAVLIVAAARPQQVVAVPLNTASIVLANDTSGSMAATDVSPTRLRAAQKAATGFLKHVPSSVRVGLVEFNSRVTVLQSPTTDRSLVRSALTELKVTGGTAIGDAIRTSLRLATSAKKAGAKQPPAAIVLLSDGSNDVGSDPLTAAQQAAKDHIPIYTVVLGTAHGTVAEKRANGGTVNVPVPPDPQQLAQIASISHGKAFTATDAKGLNTVYERLGAQLGHKKVKREITASFAGGGLALLLLGGAASLAWFGRLV